jgi:uncharacterized paraquat-inducible protein A
MGEFKLVVQFLEDNALLIIAALLAVLLSALYRIRRHHRDFTKLQEELEMHGKEELQRQGYCQQLGHDLDEECLCRRCLTRQHDPEVIDVKEEWVEEDPGALYLSSDFQPTGHHEKVEIARCKRCKHALSG